MYYYLSKKGYLIIQNRLIARNDVVEVNLDYQRSAEHTLALHDHFKLGSKHFEE